MKTVNLISCQEWDSIVRQTYKKPYCFQQQDGCKDRGLFEFTVPDTAEDYENDAVPEIVNHDEMGVSFAAWLKRDPGDPLSSTPYSFSLALWWERNFYPCFQVVANDLHAKGLLQAGDYVIRIDW